MKFKRNLSSCTKWVHKLKVHFFFNVLQQVYSYFIFHLPAIQLFIITIWGKKLWRHIWFSSTCFCFTCFTYYPNNKEIQIRRRYNWIFARYFLFWYLKNCFYSPKTLNHVKLGCAVTFLRYLASVFYNTSTENFTLE